MGLLLIAMDVAKTLTIIYLINKSLVVRIHNYFIYSFIHMSVMGIFFKYIDNKTTEIVLAIIITLLVKYILINHILGIIEKKKRLMAIGFDTVGTFINFYLFVQFFKIIGYERITH